MTLSALAQRHCAAQRPAIVLDAFVRDVYGISGRQLRHMAAGKRQPSARVLTQIHAAQVALFPGEIVTLELPTGLRIQLGSHSSQS